MLLLTVMVGSSGPDSVPTGGSPVSLTSDVTHATQALSLKTHVDATDTTWRSTLRGSGFESLRVCGAIVPVSA